MSSQIFSCHILGKNLRNLQNFAHCHNSFPLWWLDVCQQTKCSKTSFRKLKNGRRAGILEESTKWGIPFPKTFFPSGEHIYVYDGNPEMGTGKKFCETIFFSEIDFVLDKKFLFRPFFLPLLSIQIHPVSC